MNSFAIVAVFALLACAKAGLIPSTKIVQGPSTKTTVVGPGGGLISSVAPGGTIISEETPGIVAHSAPVIAAAHTAYAAPGLTEAAYALPVAHSVHHDVAAQSAGGTVVAGPSGTIATGKSLHSPAVVAHHAPFSLAHHELYI